MRFSACITTVKRDFVCIHENEIRVSESYKDGINNITVNQKNKVAASGLLIYVISLLVYFSQHLFA
jgi:hypothetical protein